MGLHGILLSVSAFPIYLWMNAKDSINLAFFLGQLTLFSQGSDP